MIQDIAPHKLINSYDSSAHPQTGDHVLVFSNDKVLIRSGSDGTIVFPVVEMFAENYRNDMIYLFTVDGERYFLLADSDISREGFEYFDMQQVRKPGMQPQYCVFILMTAVHLYRWYAGNRFCGRCGHRMIHDMNERAVICPECGHKEYPRINPAVIVGVINGDRLLLTKYRQGYRNNALVAGFTEIGESLEQTVEREVMEECGIKVKNIRYYKSQPWGIAADILAGFYCDVDGDTEITMDANELKEAHWVRREDIVLQETEYSLTNEMMKRFKDGLDC
ncbi:MAG: NAD(+) diphosphatase [Erysipelotrichaceae bacterium]|nr:NAD(+) diphosphatase [Erysipelotrichaceae bacterium]